MVSFFGLKFGDKKKKSDGKAALQKQPQQWKRIDQNALGEGQFFGQNIHQKGVINGSIRSVSRAGTPQPGASGRSPYAHYDTHNLAAVSMYDLSHPARRGSQTSLQLKPHASDINLRTRLGAHNGSSTSLALPTPGFGARFGANNASSTSLAAPMPGFGSRPGTPNRSKPWVNPLDVHFARSSPSGPPTPKSPLAASMQLPPTPTTDTAENGSVFGEDADDMVDAVMAAVKRQEQEAREAKERERELEKQRETARLEMERLERQKSTESNLAWSST
ncbi:dc7a68c1-62f4-4ad6-90ee-0133be09a06d [Thermothielavioides terrestris]|uniref:Dc7a68c1-62f4-4ad6-90ee-0133be09a06d n=1 Tax=Thermothielavioides terrestris TaxID=2587410 RepID=A0A446B9F3_9PEZI|nr:dc7a68c1-62f4-4ad6-90ee-0133be09a06d [Thermothielavioides terrestris]